MRHIDDSIAAHVRRLGKAAKPGRIGLLRAIAGRVADPWADQPAVRLTQPQIAALTGYGEDAVKTYLNDLVKAGCVAKVSDGSRKGNIYALLRPAEAHHEGVPAHPAAPTPDETLAALAEQWMRSSDDLTPLTSDELQVARVVDLMRRNGLVIRPGRLASTGDDCTL